MALKRRTKNKIYLALGVIAFVALLMVFAFSGGNFALLKSLFVKELSEEQLRDQLMNFGLHVPLTLEFSSLQWILEEQA